MIRNFLEMRELLTDEEEADGIQPVLIRVLVKDKAEAMANKSKYTAEFVGKTHKDTHHVCPHPNGACTEEEI